ncbi:MAG: RsmD family RNA methyltransferase [Kosmotogaceae bacterium]|nr:RsmD family RNA methyltransferase [Kosmotogaceae bacterium]
MLTITGGTFARRTIKTTTRKKTRHTPQSARKALFDVIDMNSKSFLDLFSGSGIMSFEALSRGAVGVLAVEISRKACNSILGNKREIDPLMDLEILCSDFRRAIPSLVRRGIAFDVVFADPPFDEEYIQPLMAVLERSPELLNFDGMLVVESSVREKEFVSQGTGAFNLVDQRDYAGVVFSIMVKK